MVARATDLPPTRHGWHHGARQGCEKAPRRTNPESAHPTPAPPLRHSTLPPSETVPCTDFRSGLRHLPREPLSTPQQPPIIAASTA